MTESWEIVGFGGGILSGLLLIPYFGWGIYTLRLRYRFHEDLAPALEGISLGVVALFYVCEVFLLKVSLGHMGVYLVFAILGLFVSGAALYGPMLISFLSRLLVDLIIPDERSKIHEPQYGLAEALERDGDYEAALGEYLVIARIFPKDAKVLVRVADNYAKLDRFEEAAQWFERAIKLLDLPEKSLAVTNRLCEIYSRQLDRPQDAVRVLEAYLDRFPEAEYAPAVRKRLERLKEPA